MQQRGRSCLCWGLQQAMAQGVAHQLSCIVTVKVVKLIKTLFKKLCLTFDYILAYLGIQLKVKHSHCYSKNINHLVQFVNCTCPLTSCYILFFIYCNLNNISTAQKCLKLLAWPLIEGENQSTGKTAVSPLDSRVSKLWNVTVTLLWGWNREANLNVLLQVNWDHLILYHHCGNWQDGLIGGVMKMSQLRKFRLCHSWDYSFVRVLNMSQPPTYTMINSCS